MSELIDGMLAQAAGKPDEETISVRAADLRLMCSQATARGKMISIYEEMLTYAADAITVGRQDLDLASAIIKAISSR